MNIIVKLFKTNSKHPTYRSLIIDTCLQKRSKPHHHQTLKVTTLPYEKPPLPSAHIDILKIVLL